MRSRVRTSLKDREAGFTLVELLVVMIIIGILAAIAIPVFLNQRNSGYDAATKSDVKNGSTAEETYFMANNGYTKNGSGGAGTNSGPLVGWTKSSNTKTVTFSLVSSTGYKIVGVSKSGKSFCYNSSTAAGVVTSASC